MARREVLMIGNPKLREESANITNFDNLLKEVVQDLKDTLSYLQKEKNIGRALAAPQISYLKKAIYYNSNGEEIVMVNPKIIWKSEEMFDVWDSCFSFEVAFFVKIKRYKKIKVRYQNEDGKEVVQQFDDDLSELFQHEIDHLYGKLATDYLIDSENIIMRSEWEKRYK
ncbi:peptide deformylase [Halanaerobium saccharolyticum]|uniref:Peptide deformylase n=1 Tax=Halanaerobium saccharolyticum TaxID=43595 RepID=A0A4R7YVA2_9FIRM|nr:peptide deformylase [Halanaerobium saccharolyticum]RAK06515.1 peptide deformylase [Halanaerobium saccharolyticum]TDW01059.1 peptide deformylase [Halanaerobium saccharolyticum]TDX52640.1 peptide deformylase [Halanaerobium saccharolyticum]